MSQNEQGLFRQNAIDKQATRLDGSVSIVQPLSSQVLFGFLAIIFVIALVFLSTTSFNRKETVVGYLTPDKGITKVYSPMAGTVQNIMVETGDWVEQGQGIALISNKQRLTSGQSLQSNLHLNTQSQISLLDDQISSAKAIFQKNALSMKESLLLAQKSLSQTRTQTELVSKRLSIQTHRFNKMMRLFGTGAIAKNNLNLQEEQVIVLQQRVAELKIQQQQKFNELAILEGKYSALPDEHEKELAQLELQKEKLSKQTLMANLNKERLITAPTTGRITNIAVNKRGSVSNQRYLLSIVPKGSRMEAVLLVPSHAYGFIKPGQNAKLRIDAFPYQKFGLFDGVVKSIGENTILPGELEMPVAFTQPAYRVILNIKVPQNNANEHVVRLKPGMIVSADILLDKRSLISWLFEPFLNLKGSV